MTFQIGDKSADPQFVSGRAGAAPEVLRQCRIGIERWPECARAGKRSRAYHARQHMVWQLLGKAGRRKRPNSGFTLGWVQGSQSGDESRSHKTRLLKTSFATALAMVHWWRHQRSDAVRFSVEWTTCFCDLWYYSSRSFFVLSWGNCSFCQFGSVGWRVRRPAWTSASNMADRVILMCRIVGPFTLTATAE